MRMKAVDWKTFTIGARKGTLKHPAGINVAELFNWSCLPPAKVNL